MIFLFRFRSRLSYWPLPFGQEYPFWVLAAALRFLSTNNRKSAARSILKSISCKKYLHVIWRIMFITCKTYSICIIKSDDAYLARTWSSFFAPPPTKRPWKTGGFLWPLLEEAAFCFQRRLLLEAYIWSLRYCKMCCYWYFQIMWCCCCAKKNIIYHTKKSSAVTDWK